MLQQTFGQLAIESFTEGEELLVRESRPGNRQHLIMVLGVAKHGEKGQASVFYTYGFLGNIRYQGAVTYPPFAVIRHLLARHAASNSRNGCIRLISACKLWFVEDLRNINEARPALTIPRAILRSLSVSQ